MSSRSDLQTTRTPEGRAEREVGFQRAEVHTSDLSVKKPTRTEVLRTVFGLGEHDIITYDAVVDVRGATTSELADRLDRDRSNVNRSLNRLREAGIVTRGRRLLDEGGHVYQYYPVDEAFDALVARAVDRWQSAALDAVGSE